MSYHAKDPELNLLANRLRDLEWVNPLSEGEEEDAKRVLQDMRAPRHLICTLPSFTGWAVRMYLGGEQRTFGLVPNSRVGAAMRFADMVRQYFWKYRVRGAAPPTAGELNFSPDRLEQDMKEEGPALLLLERIEKHLLDTGAIKSMKDRREEKAKQKMGRINIQNTLRLNQGELLERLEGIYDRDEARHDALDFEVKTLRQEVQKLGDIVRAQTEAIQALSMRVIQTPPPFIPTPWIGDPVPYTPGPGTPCVPGTMPIITCKSETSCITPS